MNSIKEIKVKGILLDIEGVLLEEDTVIPGAVECLDKITSKNEIKLRFLTNTTTKPLTEIFNNLKSHGFSLKPNNIFSPVIAARNFLEQKKIAKICLISNPALKQDFSDFIFDDNRPKAVILGDIYKNFDWEKLNNAFQLIKENNAVFIALHKNKYCLRGNKISLDLGPFVKALEYATDKEAVLMGKPDKLFFDMAIKNMNLSSKNVVMVGDDIHSDIAGANKNNIFSIQVKTGKYQKADKESRFIQPNMRLDSIADLRYYID